MNVWTGRDRMSAWLRLAGPAATLAVVAGFAGQALGQSSPKRGVAGGGTELANALNASWYYHWGFEPNNQAENVPILSGDLHGQYTPMIWSSSLANLQPKIDRILGYKDALGIEYVMGFNEPERTDQANMSVATAISVWQQMDTQLGGAGLKLVSPGVSDDTAGRAWLADFMAQADANNFQVDAVAFHWYGSVNIANPAASANSFLSRVDSYWNTYGLPVWITEFAGMDWGNQYTSQQIIDFNKAFLDVVIPGLESRSYVERYSWWQLGLRNQNPAWEIDSQLIDEVNGVWTPTTLGDSYVETLMEGDTNFLNGTSTGTDTIYLRGGLISNGNTTTPSTLFALDAIEGESEIGAALGALTHVNGGTVRVRNNATLVKIYSGKVTFSNATIENDGDLRVRNGELELGAGLTFGSDAGSVVVENLGTLRLTGNVNAMGNDITVQSGGTLRMESTNAGAMTSGIDVQAGGNLHIGVLGADGNVFPDTPTSFVNNGTVTVYDSETLRNMSGAGTLFVDEETLFVRDNANFTGSISVRDGATLSPVNAAGLGTIASGTVIFGDQQKGILELTGGIATLAEPLELKGRQGAAINAPHIVNTSGNNTWAGPISLTVSGTQWTIQSDAGLLTLSGGIVLSPSNLTRTLKLDGSGNGQFTGAINMDAAADNIISKSGSGTWSLNANATGIDTVNLNAGLFEVNHNLDAAATNVNNTATLGGHGSIAGSVIVKSGGKLNPTGLTDRALAIGQNLTLQTGSALLLDVAGADFPGLLADQVNITGQLIINAGVTLQVNFEPAYTPELGDSLALLSFGSIQGAFNQLVLPTLDPSLSWDTSQLHTAGLLSITSAFAPEDLDLDGDVDDADFGIAFAAFTGPGGASNSPADLDNDGDVDDADFGIAFAAFTGPGNTVNVPEPASLLLLATAGLLGCRARSRRADRVS